MFVNNIWKQLLKIDNPLHLNNNIANITVVLTDGKGRCVQEQLHFQFSIPWCYNSGASTKVQFYFLKQNLSELLRGVHNIILFVWLGDIQFHNERNTWLYCLVYTNHFQVTQI